VHLTDLHGLDDDDGESDDGRYDWAGLTERVDRDAFIEQTVARRLVGYFRDCAVATQRGLSVHNVEDREAHVLPVGIDGWETACGDGYVVPGREALNLALANQVNPFEKPLVMGALFVVGRYRKGSSPSKNFCAPLLVASVSQSCDAATATFVVDGDVGLNLPLLASLCDVDRDNEEEMAVRFEGVMDAVPDAPLMRGEMGFAQRSLRDVLWL
jgi:hypothetical protein